MTKRELNRDIKRLAKLDAGYSKESYGVSEDINLLNKMRTEFRRLYCADMGFEVMGIDSMKTLLRMNLKYSIIPTHLFGLYIKIQS